MIQMHERFPWGPICCGIVLYLAVQAMFVGLPAVGGSSEAREIQVVDVIVRDGTWVLPLRNGIIPSKPPLYHWIAATLSLGVGEVSEFTARFTSQLCAAVCLLMLALVSFRFAQATRSYQSQRHPRRAALLTAGILSTTYGFYQMGCQAMVDMTFAACVWLALAAVALTARATSGGEKPISEWGRTLFWLACSIGILARGPLAVVLPVALVGVAGWCVIGFFPTVRLFALPSFGWLAFTIPATWYYFAYLVGGEEFFGRQVYFENFKRLTGGEFVNSESWWFYGPSLFRTTFPWILMFLWVFISSITRPPTVSYPSESRRIRWLPLILLCTGLVLFSLSSGKRHSYLLPLLPLVALQLGVELSSLFEAGGERARVRAARMGRVTEVTLVIILVVILFV
jgi:4-amino-4-deoxy-L-arabinose transferase-like glycosyltransferase